MHKTMAMEIDKKTYKQLITEISGLKKKITTLEELKINISSSNQQNNKLDIAHGENKNLIKILAENARDMIYRISIPNGHYEYVSAASVKLFGYTPNEFYESPLLIKKVIHPDWQSYFEEQWKLLLKGKLEATYEYQIIHKSGITKWLFQRNILRSDNGKPIALEGIVTDITERKLAEQALRESKERFDLAMKATKDGIYDWNLTTNKIYYSPGWKNMLGYKDSELPNDISVWETLTAPEDIKNSWQMLNDLIEQKQSRFELEFKMKHKNGHWVEILSRANALFNKSGKAIRIVGTHINITERNQKDEALRASEEKFRTLVNLAPAGIYLTNSEGYCTFANNHWLKMNGMKLNEALGSGWTKRLHPEDKERIQSFWNKCQKSQSSWNFEYRFLSPKGKTTWVHGLANPFFDSNKNLLGYIGINIDITDQKQAKEKLIKSEERLRQIIENSHEWIWEIDAKGLYTFSNNLVKEILGYEPEEIINKKHFYDSFITNEKEELKNIAFNAFKLKKPFHNFINRNITKTGKIVYLSTSGVPLTDKTGKLIGYRGVDVNITERKIAEEKIAKHQIHLENEVKLRTIELENKNATLKEYVKLFEGRELKMIELKKEIRNLETQLQLKP